MGDLSGIRIIILSIGKTNSACKGGHILRRIWQGCILIVSLVTCVACSSVISSNTRSLADTGIAYAEMAANPAAYVGKTMLVGGTIIHATNLQDGTRLEILQFPLGSRDRPRTDRVSGGRFLVLTPEYLETAIYRQGRAITLVGDVQGERDLPLGETTYHYPLLTPRELYLWSEDYDVPRVRFGVGVGFGRGF